MANGTMTLMVEEKKVEFDLLGVVTPPMAFNDRTCLRVDSIDELVRET